jgi:heme oxygenase
MILAELRKTTRSLHEALEKRIDLLNPEFSREKYLHILKRFYGFYSPLEAKIGAYGDQAQQWIAGDRRKAHLLAADLRWAGLSEQSVAGLSRCSDLPLLSDPARELGCMYVLEGSTLGGQVVLRHLRDRLHLNGKGTAFFGSYGERVGMMWRSFCERLESECKSASDCDAIIESASSTFTCLDHWICQNVDS